MSGVAGTAAGSARRPPGATFLAAAGAVAWLLVFSRLDAASAWLAHDLLRLPMETRLGSAVQFFLFEVPKVMMLLVAVVFGVGVLRSFFSPERTRAMLAARKSGLGNVLAAGLGTVTPFCSCSAVPLFIGFLTAGVPLGVTFSFLIAAPMVNEVALALLFGLFGWRVAGLYLSMGLAVAIVAGWVIGRLGMEASVEPWVLRARNAASPRATHTPTRDERVRLGWAAVQDILGRVWPFVLAGIAVGSAIHGYVPEGVMASIMGRDSWWSVPAAVLLGVPMYSNAAGIIPVVHALLGKGAALGTVLAFMMSVIALSLPEMILLRQVLKPRLIGVFVGVVAAGIIGVGFLFNSLI